MKKICLILMTIVLFFCGCSKSTSRKEYPCGFWGLGRVGQPDLVLGDIVNRINDIYREEGGFPHAQMIFQMLPSGKMFIYYSFTDSNYQLAYWSGETTWIYDFNTDSYYETDKDMMKERWFNLHGINVNLDKINYVPLSVK